MDNLVNKKEVKHAQILDKLNEGKISPQEAALRMDITPHHVGRLAKRYRQEGVSGLISKKRGRASNRQLDEALRTTTIEVIGAHYRDFGPTLAYGEAGRIARRNTGHKPAHDRQLAST